MEVEQASRIDRAWAQLAEVATLSPRQVIVRARSMLGREGWLGVVYVGDTLTVAAPTAELAASVEVALSTLPSAKLTADDVIARLPALEVLGPASLLYPTATSAPARVLRAVRGSKHDLERLRSELSADEFEESGLEYVDSELFVVRNAAGAPTAACGYERWPGGIAQLCVATASSERRRGAGRDVAAAAVAHAIENQLLPQWRARHAPSLALARTVGFEAWGFQLSVRVS